MWVWSLTTLFFFFVIYCFCHWESLWLTYKGNKRNRQKRYAGFCVYFLSRSHLCQARKWCLFIEQHLSSNSILFCFILSGDKGKLFLLQPTSPKRRFFYHNSWTDTFIFCFDAALCFARCILSFKSKFWSIWIHSAGLLYSRFKAIRFISIVAAYTVYHPTNRPAW